MALDASIEWPAADVRLLWAQIDRAQSALGKSLGAALKMAANSVARSLGTSARVSDKYREFHPVVGDQTSRGRQAYEAIRPYYAQRRKKFYAWNDEAAKESRYVKIGRRGLAKAIWAALARGIGMSASMQGAAVALTKLAAKYGTVQANLSGADPFIKLSNTSYYAEAALKGGKNAVSTAIERAARGMEHAIDNQIARRFA